MTIKIYNKKVDFRNFFLEILNFSDDLEIG